MAREGLLHAAFNDSFAPLIPELQIALAAVGGTANRTTARFSDIDIVVMSLNDESNNESFRDALNHFRDTLQTAGFHFDLQYTDAKISFDRSPLSRIKDPKRRELAEIKLAETHLSMLGARRIAGSTTTFNQFLKNYKDDLATVGSDLLALWQKSVHTRWETFPEPPDSASFDSKGSIGALRECDTLLALRELTHAAGISRVFITDAEAATVQELREPLLKLKHRLHLLLPEDGAPPNPEDRKFTACSLQKLHQILPDSSERNEALYLLAHTRSELKLLAARVNRRVADFIHDVKPPDPSELREDSFMRAYAAFRAECYAETLAEDRIVAAVMGLFAAWRVKLGPIDPRKVLRALSTVEHEVLDDVLELGKLFDATNFPHSPSTARAMRSILEGPGPRAPILELMHRAGWLGLIIPEHAAGERMNTSKMEDPVSLSRHGLDTVKILDSLLGHSFPLEENHPFSGISRLFIEKPETLYLAGLFHDLGHLPAAKPEHQNKSHEERGALLSYRTARSLGYSEYDAYRVQWLVRNHHKLRALSRRASPSEAVLGERVMGAVGFPDMLVMLHALSAADALATPRRRNESSSHVWLREAFEAGMSAMNLDGLLPDQDSFKRRIAQAFGRVSKSSDSEALEAVTAHLAQLPRSYASETSPEEIVHHLVGALQTKHPYIYWINEGEPNTELTDGSRPQRVVIVAPDKPGLLSRMCGGISAFPIKEARIFTTQSGLACNVITVAVPRAVNQSDLVRYSSGLEKALTVKPPPARTFLESYRTVLQNKGAQPDVVSYQVEQQATTAGAEITVRGPDRKHLASILAALFPGIVTAKFAQGSAPGTVFDSFVLPQPLSDEMLQRRIRKLNEHAGVLPAEGSS
jgi:UTP:GlnB (protein PII) uridylyltransferase